MSGGQAPKVGDLIEVFWPDDEEWYGGQLGRFFRPTGRFVVNYEDGDREVLNLKKERWRYKGEEEQTKEQVPRRHSEPPTKQSPSRAARNRATAPVKTKRAAPPTSKKIVDLVRSDDDEPMLTPPSPIETDTVVKPRSPVMLSRPKKSNRSSMPASRSLPWQSDSAMSDKPSSSKSPSGYVSEETISAGGPTPASTPPERPPLKLKLPISKKRLRPGPSATEVSVAEALASLEVQMQRTVKMLERSNERPKIAPDAAERLAKFIDEKAAEASARYDKVASVLDAVNARNLAQPKDMLSVLYTARSQIIDAFTDAKNTICPASSTPTTGSTAVRIAPRVVTDVTTS